MQKLECSYLASDIAEWCGHFGKQFTVSSKSEIQNFRMTQQSHSEIHTEENRKYFHMETDAQIFTAALL